MTTLNLQSADGKPYVVTLPEPRPGVAAAFLFAFAKSGSTLLNDMISTYCQVQGVPTFSLFDTAFAQGVSTHLIAADAAECFQPEGVIYTGFRHFPMFDLDLGHATSLLLVRDPRDMLVSMYYSMVKSHEFPDDNEHLQRNRRTASQITIDQFVINNAGDFRHHFKRYQTKLVQSRASHTYRYEDVVFDKANWLTDMVGRLGLEVQPPLVAYVAKRFDVIPEAEDESQHIRQVHPGDHRNKLEAATIERLNEELAGFLEAEGYR